jgi:hypothetical protein
MEQPRPLKGIKVQTLARLYMGVLCPISLTADQGQFPGQSILEPVKPTGRAGLENARN